MHRLASHGVEFSGRQVISRRPVRSSQLDPERCRDVRRSAPDPRVLVLIISWLVRSIYFNFSHPPPCNSRHHIALGPWRCCCRCFRRRIRQFSCAAKGPRVRPQTDRGRPPTLDSRQSAASPSRFRRQSAGFWERRCRRTRRRRCHRCCRRKLRPPKTTGAIRVCRRRPLPTQLMPAASMTTKFF